MSNKQAWLQFSEKLLENGSDIFENAIANYETPPNDSKRYALTLLARTINNFQAGILLVNNDFVVEARTMVRCCYENFFWIASLSKMGNSFIDKMNLDDAAHRITHAKSLIEWSKSKNNYDFEEQLNKIISSLTTKYGKTSTIKNYDAASDGDIGETYIIYRQLCGDSAHHSATSLSRHVSLNGDAPHLLPLDDPYEVEETLELACKALIGVLVDANIILELPDNEARLSSLWNEFATLRNENNASKASDH
ncbi:hypothetical protein M2323_000356 [Rhodoblastus acidophilus]|uniref:DUF5677 domain-containing protein n=1 Tax=Rhodoblastus acidophilus TaxID=1074 RepID=UPI00222500F2|nr:DUF5677 domain-containing protein [Rhodoblastus acidophilus]MCW2282595.1 hypothetical protein [Rhodoblastus acidophilus]MCW2331456.1 hypothetical protein [Rhodoblastus acidophilus]